MIAFSMYKSIKNKRDEKKLAKTQEAIDHNNVAYWNGQQTGSPETGNSQGNGQAQEAKQRGYQQGGK